MLTGLLYAMRGEIKSLLTPEAQPERVAAGVAFYRIRENVVACCGGVGKVNAAMAAALLIQRYHPDLILNAGVAGCFEEVPIGTLVLAGQQKAGRGRLGRRFESPAGKGVYCSLLLRPALSAADAQTATIAAAVSVARAVKALCGLELGIKWVNDLYYQGKKVCGILTEAGTDIESGQVEWLVVGIGLNLTSPPADWPEELAPTAGSLFPGGPSPVSRTALAGAIARELLALCPAFDCLDEYRARCFVPGHWVTVCTGTETYAAKALAIDEEGRLVIQRENGRQEALRCGEVTTRPARTE